MITLDLKERFVLLIDIQMEMGNSNLIFRSRFKLIFDMFITIIMMLRATRHTLKFKTVSSLSTRCF